MDIFMQLDLEDLRHIFRWLRYVWKYVRVFRQAVRWHPYGGMLLVRKRGTNQKRHRRVREVLNSSPSPVGRGHIRSQLHSFVVHWRPRIGE